MAFVSLSKDLLNDISSTIDRLKNTEIATSATYEKISDAISQDAELRQNLREQLYGDLFDLEPRLKQHDYTIRLDLQIAMVITGHDGVDRDHIKEIALDGFSVPVFCWKAGGSNYYLEHRAKATSHPHFEEVQRIYAERMEMTNRWNKVQEQVMAFLRTCKSLNEAIKLWPDVTRYIPSDAIERVNRKVEKSSPKESKAALALAAIDMDMVTSSTVLARMAGARI